MISKKHLKCLTLVLLVFSLLIIASFSAFSGTATLSSSGASYSTIQQALNNANNYDTVSCIGTFTENVVWPNKNFIKLKASTSSTSTPVISGNVSGRIIKVPYAVTLTVEGISLTSGLTIETGGGIYLASGANLYLNDVIAGYCSAEPITSSGWPNGRGGFLYISPSAKATLTHCFVISNQARFGGGIFNDGSLKVDSCWFQGNYASRAGGAIDNNDNGAGFTVFNSILNGNMCAYEGGAIAHCGTGTAHIYNNTFYNNLLTATGLGSEIIIWSGSTNTIQSYNNIIFENPPTAFGSSIDNASLLTSSFNMTYSDFVGVEGPGISSINNILVNPGLANASNSDFHLSSTSPCLGKGTATGAPSYDYDGNVRSTSIDQGAYQLPHVLVTVTAPNGGELLYQGTTYPVTWTVSDVIEGASATSIKGNIRYSLDNGPWTLLTNYTLGGSGGNYVGQYTWTVPAAFHSNCRISIEAVNNNGTVGIDSSNGYFTITKPGAVFYVNPTSGNDSNNGLTPTTPFQNIVKALSISGNSARIYLMDGLYNQGTINNWPSASYAQDIRMTGYSGLPGNIKVSGNGTGIVFDLSSASTSLRGTIEGITISGGHASGNGGGVSLPSGSVFQVRSCTLDSNSASNGGGMSEGMAVGCTFTNNTATNVGGAQYDGFAYNTTYLRNNSLNGGAISNVTATACAFSGNSANSYGGGAYNVALLDRCQFLGNYCSDGSEIYSSSSASNNVINCLINGAYSNLVAYKGTGTMNVVNCTVYGGNVIAHTGTVSLLNDILWNGALQADSLGLSLATYSDIQGGYSGSGNLNVDPSFILPGINFRLNNTSEVIDKGNPSGAPSIDIQGFARSGNPDMGAYEYIPAYVTVTNPSGGPKLEGGSVFPVTWNVVDSLGNAITFPYTDIWVSFDNGSTWSKSLTATNTNTAAWTVPPRSGLPTQCKIAAMVSNDDRFYIATGESDDFSIVDTTPPTITLETSSAGWMGLSSTITWDAYDAFGITQVILKISLNGTVTVLSSRPDGTYTYVYSAAPGTNLPKGSVYISATAYDSNGLSNTTTLSGFGIDTVAPTMEITLPASSSSQTVAFGMTAYDLNGISMVGVLPGEGATWTTKASSAISGKLTVKPPLIGNHVITFEAYDIAGNMTSEPVSIYLNLPIGPQISNVMADGKNIRAGDYLSGHPWFSFDVTDYQGNVLRSASVALVGNNGIANSYPAICYNSATDVTAYTAEAGTPSSPTPTSATTLSSGSYKLSVTAVDTYNHVTTYEINNLNFSTSAKVTGKPRNVPNPFKTVAGKGTTLIYNLAADTDIKLIVYDITGRAVWTKTFAAGTNGGRGPALDNEVYWDGTTDLGQRAGNGVYIYVITSKGKVLSKGQMAVMD